MASSSDGSRHPGARSVDGRPSIAVAVPLHPPKFRFAQAFLGSMAACRQSSDYDVFLAFSSAQDSRAWSLAWSRTYRGHATAPPTAAAPTALVLDAQLEASRAAFEPLESGRIPDPTLGKEVSTKQSVRPQVSAV